MKLSPQKIEYNLKWNSEFNTNLEIVFRVVSKFSDYKMDSKKILKTEDEIFDFCFDISNSPAFLIPFVRNDFEMNTPDKYLKNCRSEGPIIDRYDLDIPEEEKEFDAEMKVFFACLVMDDLIIQEESDNEKATTLISSYFKIFKTDEINKKNWISFVRMFDLNKQSLLLENYLKDDTSEYYLNNGQEKYDLYINSKDVDVKSVRRAKEGFTIYNYLCLNSKDIICATINKIFEEKPNAIIKKCTLCGKLFVPKKSDTKYCNRENIEFKNKTCKEVSEAISKKKYNEKDPLLYLRRKVYNKLDRTNIQSPSDVNKAEIDKFWLQDKEITNQYKLGIIHSDEYKKWLLSFYKTGPKNYGDSDD